MGGGGGGLDPIPLAWPEWQWMGRNDDSHCNSVQCRRRLRYNDVKAESANPCTILKSQQQTTQRLPTLDVLASERFRLTGWQ